jgi:opacity protein-like surface antigen
MVYGLAGVEVAAFSTSTQLSFESSLSRGTRYGGGVEAMLWRGVVLRAQYDRTDFNGGSARGVGIDATRDAFRFGLAYRF